MFYANYSDRLLITMNKIWKLISIWDLGFGIWDFEFGIALDLGFGMSNLEFDLYL